MGFNKRAFLLAATFLITALLLAGCGQARETTAKTEGKVDLSGYKNPGIFITPQELSERLGKKDIVIFDFNKPDVYAKGHIPGAINVGWTNFSRMDGKPGDKNWGAIYNKDELTKALQSYGVDNSKTVVAYSDVLKGPGPDGRLVWQLKMAGFENAKLLYGGMAFWEKSGGKLTTDPVSYEASTSLALKDFDGGYNATTGYIAQNLGTTKVVDCRTRKEYDGAQNNGEARGGHIAGAVFLEWKDLLNPDATPKPAAEIVAIMKDKGITPQDDFVVY